MQLKIFSFKKHKQNMYYVGIKTFIMRKSQSPLVFIIKKVDSTVRAQIRKDRCCLGVALLLPAKFKSRGFLIGLAYFSLF